MSFFTDARDLGLLALGAAGNAMTSVADFAKADTEGPEAGPKGADADTAESNPVPTEKAAEDPKSLFWDPFAIIEQMGYKDRPSQLTYGTLKAMVYRMPILFAIIQTRINQVASFSQVQHDRYQLGFRIKLRDSEKEPTRLERDWMQQMESLITRTGVTDNPRGRDNFNTFLRKVTWDTLVYDQYCVELVPNRKGDPCEWYAVDASTIRLADSASTYLDEDLEDATRYVQIYDGMVLNEYSQSELYFGVRNPKADIRLFGYGTAETEMILETITALIYGFTYNKKQFSQGLSAKGFLNFKGAISEKQMQMFRRFLYQQLSGVESAWKTPVTNAEDLQYINLQQSSRDMEFNAYMDFMIKICCSAFQMDPIEVNFQYGNAGVKSSLNEASNKEKITESKERGLRPLLVGFAEAMNQSIVWPINEAFEFAFVGLDAMTRDQLADLNAKRVKTHMTVDQLRAEDDMPPMPNGTGECILDSTWIQFSQQKEGGMEDGEPGEGDNDFESMMGGFGKDKDEDQGEGETKGTPKGGKPGKPGKPGAPAEPDETEKSLVRWEVQL